MNARPDRTKRQILGVEEALELWRQGSDEWNAWVEANPDIMIDFSNVDFSAERDDKSKLSFADHRFGNGGVSFKNAKFGKGEVTFARAKFGEGNIYFDKAKFGEGNIYLDKAKFGEGDIYFDEAKFGDRVTSFRGVDFGRDYISFRKTKFGNGHVDFNDANFGGGCVTFADAEFGNSCVRFGAKFGDSDVCFNNAKFGKKDVKNPALGKSEVYFERAEFGSGYVSFVNVNFSECNVSFSKATFGDSNLHFTNTIFDDGNLSLKEAKFGSGRILFQNAKFGNGQINFADIRIDQLTFDPKKLDATDILGKGIQARGLVKLSIPKDATHLQSIDLSSAVFQGPVEVSIANGAAALKTIDLRFAALDGPLTLSGSVNAPPDLRGTKLTHHTDLSNLKVRLSHPREPVICNLRHVVVAGYPEDAPRFGRLKQIAEDNRDHAAALRFAADENRAKRWRQTPWIASLLDMAYCGISNYGQSILRPALCLFFSLFAFGGWYWCASKPSTDAQWDEALQLSLRNSLPFLPQSRIFRDEALTALYGDAPSWLGFATIAQGLVSVILVFLIGLGLRNRFRL